MSFEKLEEVLDYLGPKIKASGFEHSAIFDIKDVGTLVFRDGILAVEETAAADTDADVKLSASAEIFEGLLDGSVDSMSTFMKGQLKVDGNVGLALKLGQIFSK